MNASPMDPSSIETGLMSIEEFERLPDDGLRRELVRGQVIKEPPAEEVKTCPFCKEPNAVDASRCKACTSEI